MAEANSTTNIIPPDVFPDAAVPTIFADGTLNFQPGSDVVRFYFGRWDPAANGTPNYQTRAVAQIIMPVTGFAQMAAFFEQSTEKLVKDGLLQQDQLDQLRKAYRDSAAAKA